MGHAVYSLSDPREVVFKGYVEQLAHEKGRDKDLALYNKIEHMAPQLIAEERQNFLKGVSPNCGLLQRLCVRYAGHPHGAVHAAVRRGPRDGLERHRIEELLSANKIIRRPTRPWRHPRIYPPQ